MSIKRTVRLWRTCEYCDYRYYYESRSSIRGRVPPKRRFCSKLCGDRYHRWIRFGDKSEQPVRLKIIEARCKKC